jgi:tetratricopeptide (TPR) repeat protein/tRNA A-37 threonylcarbamoyl transferase component Bud32
MGKPDPPPAADRNLLFGVLALQMDFVGRDDLVAAMHAWVLDKAKPLGQLLVEHGALRPDARELLEALVAKHLELHGDAQRSLAAVSSLGPVRDDLRRIADSDLQASLAHVSAARPADDPAATRAPSTVGTPTSAGLRFRTLRPHARGGLGEVFVAYDEELHREVALKEIQDRHADSPESRSRFVLEAEITGGLEHPGVVPVYGLGHYADGRPFYAMRFVRGDSLQQAVARFHQAEATGHDRARRAVEFRALLGRFIDVCNAVAYAHSRGVLHRDLKPGNVMLGKYGETLVVDWGLAKVQGRPEVDGGEESPLRPASASGTPETLPGSAVGTPQFMSPEQAAGRLDELGPASDVYSLGATLYCLLTGKPPFPDPREVGGLGELLQRVQRGEFPPPRQVKREVPAALSAVCLKAMALKPGDRYATPRALADDVERWLADEAVSAWRGPWWVRLGRWGRRHRPLVTGAAALLLTAVAALSAGVVLLGRKQAEVVQERNAARKAKDEAEAINKFLVEDLLASARPEELGKDVPMRKVLDKAAEKVETSFPDQPEVEAAVRLAIGDSYRSLGMYTDAEPHVRRALALRRECLGPTHPDTWKATDGLVRVLVKAGKYAEAESLIRDTLEARRGLLGAEHPDTLYSLHDWGWWLLVQGRYAEAEPLYRQCLEARRRVVGSDHRRTLMTAHNLAQVLVNQGKLDEGERLTRETLEARRRALGPEHPHSLISMNDLGLVLHKQRKLDEAEALYREALERERRVYGRAHPETRITTENFAGLLGDRGKLEEAERLYRENLGACQRAGGPEHPDTVSAMKWLASWLAPRKPNEAEALYRKALEIGERVQGKAHPNTLNTVYRLAQLLWKQGRLDEAERLHRQNLEARRRVLGPEHADTLESMNDLAAVLHSLGKLDEAEPLFRETLESERRVLGAEHPTTLATISNLATLLQDRGRLDEAEELLRKVLTARRRAWGAEYPETMRAMNNLAVLLLNHRSKPAEAEQMFRQVLENWRRTRGPEHEDTVIAQENLAVSLQDQQRFEEAERLQREAIAIRVRVQGGDHPQTLALRSFLACMLDDQGKMDEAERLHREVLESRRRTLGPEHTATLDSMYYLALVLADQGKAEEAERPYREVLRTQRKNLPAGHADLAPTLTGLGGVLTTKGQAKEAEPLLREGLEIRKKTLPKEDWRTGNAASVLGGCLTALGRYTEAEPLLLGGYATIKASPAAMPRRVQQALARIIKLFDAWKKPEKAAEWRAKLKETEQPAKRPNPR